MSGRETRMRRASIANLGLVFAALALLSVAAIGLSSAPLRPQRTPPPQGPLGEAQDLNSLDGDWEYYGGSGKAKIKHINQHPKDKVTIDATWTPTGDRYLVDATITKQKAESWQLIGTWKMITAAPNTPCTSAGGYFYAEFEVNSAAIHVLSPTYDPTGDCGWHGVVFTRVLRHPAEKWRAADFDALFGKSKPQAEPAGATKP